MATTASATITSTRVKPCARRLFSACSGSSPRGSSVKRPAGPSGPARATRRRSGAAGRWCRQWFHRWRKTTWGAGVSSAPAASSLSVKGESLQFQ